MIDFYFSIGSTYTYLAVTRILDVEKNHQVSFNWKPFSVRVIMKEMNNIPFPKDKLNKVNYMWRDIERRAEGYGFFAKTPVPYPLSEFDLANQIAILGLDKSWGVDYVRLTYKKWFQEGKEPAIEPSISEVCKELKLNKDEIISEAKTKLIEDKYLANTNSARENKIFGSPSFVVKNEIFSKIELLTALESHGTPISLRNYCLVFIYLFPWIYTPSLIQDTESLSQDYSVYMAITFSVFISFILMALFNVQSFIENPFDQKGLDDIKLKEFEIEESELGRL